jgi:hypothetical protein
MIGKRVEPDEHGQLMLKEGEYGKRIADGRLPGGVWYCRPPGSHMGSLMNHTITEHEDGTITVSPSILIDDGRSKWHGYLERGVWRAV